jgi:hypothetical protein
MKKIYMLLLAGLSLLAADAQVSLYTFTQAPGTYSPITGGTLLAAQTVTTGTAAGALDDVIYSSPLPFEFVYNGVTYPAGTNVNVSTNGFISFGTAPGAGNYLPVSGADNNIISAFGIDCNGGWAATGTTTTGSAEITAITNTSGYVVGALVSGTGVPTGATIVSINPNVSITISAVCTSSGTGRTISCATGEIRAEQVGSDFVIQYRNMRRYNVALSRVNAQIRLTQTTNEIKIVYGDWFAATSNTPQVGLRGSAATDFSNRTSTTSWAASTAGATNTATMTWSGTVLPTAGQTYTWTPPVVCTGAPSSVAIASTTSVACAGTNLTITSTVAPINTAGFTYQWQSSPAGLNTWADIVGATNTTYTTNQTTATDYRLIVTCTAAAASTTSNVVAIGQNLFYTCYCIPTGGNCTNEWVNGVTFNTLSNLNTGCTTGGYADYRGNVALTTSVNRGGTYPITLDDRINATNSQIGVWIDYNQSGTFDAAEFTLVGTGPAANFANLDLSFTANITIPLSALTGQTGMRVLAKNGTITSSAACATGNFGEWEDYLITINAEVGCSGTPEAGSITGPLVRSVCGGSAPSPATAVITGFSVGVTNLTIQWETSTDNNTWINATGTGNATATYTLPNHTGGQIEYYRAKVTCTTSGLFDVTDVLQVTDPTAPSVQASAIIANNSGLNGASISWTNGNGARRFVVINTSNTFTDPVNGSGAALTANTTYSGSGEQIVYDGTGNSVTVSGLTCGTQYYIRVYEYTRCNAAAPFNYFYNVTTATGNPVSFIRGASVALPVCIDFTGFTGANLNTLFPNWFEAVGTTPAGTTSAWTNTTLGGSTTAKINLYLATRQEWIIGPRILATATTALEFSAAITDFNSTAADPNGMTGTDDKVMVKVSTDCGVTWTTLYTFDATNTESLRASAQLTGQTINLAAYAGQNIIIAFHATDGPLDEAPDYDFHIDNVCIRNIPNDAMDWVNLQWPPTATVTGGTSVSIYTRGYEPGVTEAAGAGTGISVWVGISPVGAPASSDPATWTNWVPATFNVQAGNDDEFTAAIGNTLAAGTYQYASRWQLNGGNYRYGGYNATGGGYWDGTTNVSGVLTVSAALNDDCGGAIAISGTTTAGGNFGSTESMAANATCSSTSSPDVWYTFTATSNGSAIIALTGVVTIDPILEAFTGTCGTLTSLGCIDNGAAGGNETQTLTGLTAGQVVYVRVSGWNGSFGTFNIAVSGGALPVNIEYFTGTKQSGQNRLDWKINCYNSPTVTMVLERSANGRNFSDLITLTETSVRCQSPFNQNDLNPLPGINYYRLKTIDIDGKIGYSNVVALLNQTKGFELVSLAPNPVVDKAVLSVTSAEKSIMEIVVTDISGKQISKQRVSLIAGNNQIQLSLKNVAAGSYQVSGLTENGEVKTLRFVKQ